MASAHTPTTPTTPATPPRDRTRQESAKARAMTRKADRRNKSAMQFLAFAFPADLDTFATRH